MSGQDEQYKDMIALPHPTSRRHPRMPRATRAAQFAPFAALAGYDEAVEETARLTEPQAELGEEGLRRLNEALQTLQNRSGEQPEAAITCFVPDARKTGGAYTCITGRIRRIDEVCRQIHLTDRTVIEMDRVYGIAIVEGCFAESEKT